MSIPAFCTTSTGNSPHVTLEDLAAERFLLLKDGHCFRDHVLRSASAAI
ncbi:MAG TPA: hypothetical protein VI455_10025 [Terriglobia bacterium]